MKCRAQKAKDYIKEAVACYKAGAFRSSIVSTWIAVSFDIIEIGTVINALRKNKGVSNDDIDEWIEVVDLKKFVKVKDKDPEDDD